MTKKLITITEFLNYSGFKSKTSYYNLIKTDPLAPQPIRVGVRKVMISLDEVILAKKVDRCNLYDITILSEEKIPWSRNLALNLNNNQ